MLTCLVIVKFVRTAVPAITLIVAVIGTATIPAFARSAHAVCATKQHECDKTLSIKPCCRGDQNGAAEQAGPVAAKVRLTRDLVPIDFVCVAAHAADARYSAIQTDASPPRAAPLDLPTLFGTLLI